jgi:hypothetical protein
MKKKNGCFQLGGFRSIGYGRALSHYHPLY